MNQGFIDEAVEEDETLEINEQVTEDVETEDRRLRMRLRRRLATLDDIVAELEDDFIPEDDSDDE